MFEWIAKKIICGKLNDFLKGNESNVKDKKEIVNRWVSRIEAILSLLKSLLNHLEDNQLDADELKETVEGVKVLVQKWK